MFMRTWDYRAILIEPVLVPLEQIFDQKMSVFFGRNDFFWLFDKSAGSAEIDEKKLRKFVYNQI